MKKHYFSTISLTFLSMICLLVSSCKPDEPLPYKSSIPSLPENSFQYANPSIPSKMLQVVDQDQLNAITNEGATLGRVLFYDKKLSINNAVACASCHRQEAGFSDPDRFSVGFEGRKTTRNSPAIVNTVSQSSFFWDSRTKNLEDLIKQPILNHIEMGMEDLDELEEKLGLISYYPDLFEKAFGSAEITDEKIASAMSQFLNSIISSNSKSDQATAGASNLTDSEKHGEQLFFGIARCYLCHSGPDFRAAFQGFGQPSSIENWANIGLDTTYTDKGIGSGNSDIQLNGVFKVPSLRNVALTAPYMHDGRFVTLAEVIDHYNEGIKSHPSLDQRLWIGSSSNSSPIRLGLTDDDQTALIEYLNTLTDNDLISNPKFSNPFDE